MVERVMESCPFKAALACVGGAAAEGRGRQLWGGSGVPVASGKGRMEKRLQPLCLIFLLSLLQCLSHVPGSDLCLPALERPRCSWPFLSTAQAVTSVHSTKRFLPLSQCSVHRQREQSRFIGCRECAAPIQPSSFHTVYLLQDLFWEVHLVSSQLALTPTWGLIPRIPIALPRPKRCSRTWGSEASPTPRTSPLWVPCSPAQNVWWSR